MLITGSSLVDSLPDIIVSEPASGIEGAAKKSPLQVTDGVHSAIECVKAWIQRPELIIYPINCSMHSSSNVQSHSGMHKKTGSQLVSELNSCFLSGFVFHTFLFL